MKQSEVKTKIQYPDRSMLASPPQMMSQQQMIMQQQYALQQQQIIRQQMLHQQALKQQQILQQQQQQSVPKQPRVNCLLFYQQCAECVNFIKTMHENNFIENFKLICLDSPQYAHLANKNIIHPTLIVATLPKPFEGIKAVYQWLETARAFKMNQIASLSASMMKQNMAGPMGFNNKEMNVSSDPYTFVKIDNPLAQNYYFHGTDQPIMTAPEETKLDKKETDEKVKSLEMGRKKEEDKLQKSNELFHESVLIKLKSSKK